MNASSDRLLRRTLWGNAVFSVVSGAVGVAYATEATTDFMSWAVLGTNVATAYTMTVTDTTAAGLDQRFYRIRRIAP